MGWPVKCLRVFNPPFMYTGQDNPWPQLAAGQVSRAGPARPAERRLQRPDRRLRGAIQYTFRM